MIGIIKRSVGYKAPTNVISICIVHLFAVILNTAQQSGLHLKGLNQAKIVKKSVILFWPLNKTIWCEHDQRQELQKFLIFVTRIHQLG